jgi:predicted outer membrane repeat protein
MIRFVKRLTASVTAASQQREPDTRAFVRLEVLESRETPAVFTIDTTADTSDAAPGDGKALDANNQTSLRAAIEEGNATLPGPHAIGFNAGLFAAAPPVITLGAALPEIPGVVAIDGSGPGGFLPVITRGGGAQFPIFTVAKGAMVDLLLLSIENGFNPIGDGGGINNRGLLNVDSCVIATCEASKGGAIANSEAGKSSLRLVNSHLAANRANNEGGAIYSAMNTSVRIIDTLITGNRAIKGGAIASNNASIRLDTVNITNNIATQTGGGIYASQGTINMLGGLISDNEAQGGPGGGGVNLSFGGQGQAGTAVFREVYFSGNRATAPECRGNGGAIVVSSFDLTIDSCEFTDNYASGIGANIAYFGILAGVDPGNPNTWININNSPTAGDPEKAGN